jgi:hypothetical protein
MPQANNNSIIPPLPRALSRAARRKVEAAVEAHLAAVTALAAFLDEVDSDPDLEPELAGTSGDGREYDPADPPAHEGIDEDERDASYNESAGRGGSSSTDSEDQECSLGWPERANQAAALNSIKGTYWFGRGQWGSPSCSDGECEPSLGSQGPEVDQRHWAHGDRREMEADYTGFPHGQVRAFTADMEPSEP